MPGSKSQQQRIKALMHRESTFMSLDFIEEKEKELVEKVCTWTLRLLMYAPAFACLFEYLSGQGLAEMIGPGSIVVSCLLVRIFAKEASTQGATVLAVLAITAFRHAILYQGCSACVIPAVYAFIPCASGLLFRTTRAVLISAVSVLTLIGIIYAIDLSGNCPSEPIDPSDRSTIVADRLIPLVNSVIFNSLVICVILRQSQESLLMHSEAAASARNLANLRRDVLHRVTHELRTPLNGLVGSVELLTISETLSVNDTENVLTIKRCLNSILDICDDVLVAAKESDKADNATNEEKPFVLASCIDDVVEVFAETVKSKGLELKLLFEGNTKTVVHGMEVRLRQVLLNLVGNAVKFTDSGSVTIHVETHEQDSDMLQCKFQVEDTGIGIDSKEADLLFEPFHQGEQGGAVSRRHKGTGLGLTICRDLVEHLGGKIAADGIRGEGSRFFFSLLMRKDPPDDAASAPGITRQPCQFVMAISEKESLASCQSVIQSDVPDFSGDVATVVSQKELLNHFSEEKPPGVETRIAFIEYTDDPSFPATLDQARKYGWLVFLFCDRENFALAAEETNGSVYAVYRKPLPLVRMGEALHEALTGNPSTSHEGMKLEAEYDKADGLRTSEDFSEYNVDGSAPRTRLEERVISSSGHVRAALGTLDLLQNTKIIVVDDTLVNVKVLVKMLSCCTTTPIIPLYDGESAIDLAESSDPDEILFFLMDWHMPGVCGLTAWESIRKTARERGRGSRIFVCMVTADIEGFCTEIESKDISYGSTISRAGVVKEQCIAGLSEEEDEDNRDSVADIDIIAGKPVTFQSVRAILTWFSEQVAQESVLRSGA